VLAQPAQPVAAPPSPAPPSPASASVAASVTSPASLVSGALQAAGAVRVATPPSHEPPQSALHRVHVWSSRQLAKAR